MSEQTTPKRVRGKGKTRLALGHINLRVPNEVIEFYKQRYPNYTGKMREVLTQFVEQHKPQDPDT
jgi:uncharacterized protein (DUF4415 family)